MPALCASQFNAVHQTAGGGIGTVQRQMHHVFRQRVVSLHHHAGAVALVADAHAVAVDETAGGQSERMDARGRYGGMRGGLWTECAGEKASRSEKARLKRALKKIDGEQTETQDASPSFSRFALFPQST